MFRHSIFQAILLSFFSLSFAPLTLAAGDSNSETLPARLGTSILGSGEASHAPSAAGEHRGETEAYTLNPDERPVLVVGVMVDQLRPDYISRFWDKLSEGGFRRLVNEGFTFTNMHFNYMPTATGP